MRNNKMKGFTLVELLVVIAILAILATVSVVGYTSYIESTNITVDENLAAQLNHKLAAYLVNFDGELNENNIREVTKAIMDESGIDNLEPKSKDSNFYFDFETRKYVLVKDDVVGANSGAYRALLGLFGVSADEPRSNFLGSSFTDGKKFIVSTGGNALANVINAFYGIDNNEAITREQLTQLKNDADDLADKFPELAAFVNSSAVIHQDTKYHYATDNKYLIIPDHADQIGEKTVVVEDGSTSKLPLVSPQNGQTTATVVIPDSIEHIASSNFDENVELGIDKSAEEIAGMILHNEEEAKVDADVTVNVTTSAGTVTIKVTVDVNGAQTNIVVDINGTEILDENKYFSNELVSFDGKIESGSANKYAVVNGVGHIAWEKGVSIALGETNFVGKNDSLPATGTSDIVWTSSIGTVSVVNNVATLVVDSITSVNDIPKTITFTGTAKNGTTAEYTVEVVYIKSIDYAIDGDSVTTYKDGMTLVYGDTLDNGTVQTTFALSQLLTDNNLSKVVPGIKFDPAFSIATNDNFTLTNGVLTPANANLVGDYSITINTEAYPHLSKTIALDMFNANSLVFKKDHINHIYVGDDNAITLGDLFDKNSGKDIPAGAEIWIFSKFANTKFGDMDSVANPTFMDEDTVKIKITDLANWDKTAISFACLEAYAPTSNFADSNQHDVMVAVVYQQNGRYVRISEDHVLTIVDGVNVTKYSDFLNDAGKTLATNFILYGNVEMSATDPVLTISSGKTLYGSGYSMDMTGYKDEGTPFTVDGSDSFHFIGLNKTVKYSKTDEALITLNSATLSNVNIVGEVYKSSDFLYQDPTSFAYGASLVKANNGSLIDGCYLANTRSPLKITGSVTVQNSTLFGGNYANIDVAATKDSRDNLVKTELILKGTVTTINQVIEGVTDETLGVGIVVDLFAHKDTNIVIESVNTLVQYNYVEKSQASLLPIVTYTMDLGEYLGKQDANIFLSTEVAKVYTDYTDWVFVQGEGADAKEYFNTGIFFLNAMVTDTTTKNILMKIPAKAVEVILNGLFTNSKGDGSKLDKIPTGYAKNFTTVIRETEKADIKIKLVETVYIYSPKNTVTFNNSVPNKYLPATVLGE